MSRKSEGGEEKEDKEKNRGAGKLGDDGRCLADDYSGRCYLLAVDDGVWCLTSQLGVVFHLR